MKLLIFILIVATLAVYSNSICVLPPPPENNWCKCSLPPSIFCELVAVQNCPNCHPGYCKANLKECQGPPLCNATCIPQAITSTSIPLTTPSSAWKLNSANSFFFIFVYGVSTLLQKWSILKHFFVYWFRFGFQSTVEN
jgi:hypothetical protein